MQETASGGPSPASSQPERPLAERLLAEPTVREGPPRVSRTASGAPNPAPLPVLRRRPGPYKRWRVHGVMPCALIRHLLVLGVASFLLLAENGQRAHSIAALRADLARTFFPDSCVGVWNFCDEPRCFVLPDCRIQRVAGVQDLVRRVVLNYAALREVAVGDIRPVNWPNTTVWLRSVTNWGQHDTFQLNTTSTATILGPFEGGAGHKKRLRHYLDDLESARLVMELDVNERAVNMWTWADRLLFPDEFRCPRGTRGRPGEGG